MYFEWKLVLNLAKIIICLFCDTRGTYNYNASVSISNFRNGFFSTSLSVLLTCYWGFYFVTQLRDDPYLTKAQSYLLNVGILTSNNLCRDHKCNIRVFFSYISIQARDGIHNTSGFRQNQSTFLITISIHPFMRCVWILSFLRRFMPGRSIAHPYAKTHDMLLSICYLPQF